MEQGILNSTKKALDIEKEYTAFDGVILMHINSTFATLNQLGIGPKEGYEIEDDKALWGDYLKSNKNLNFIKSYMYAKVKMMFDPDNTSYVLQARKEAIEEMEWRLREAREEFAWTDPRPNLVEFDPFADDVINPDDLIVVPSKPTPEFP